MKMPAAWQRINPIQLQIPGKGKFAVMVMAVAAKKHVTIFSRKRTAPGAGHPDVKAAFTTAAHKTLGVDSRAERNSVIKSGVAGKGPGKRLVRSRSKAHPGKIIREITTR
jgi:hypothetical protein